MPECQPQRVLRESAPLRCWPASAATASASPRRLLTRAKGTLLARQARSTRSAVRSATRLPSLRTKQMSAGLSKPPTATRASSGPAPRSVTLKSNLSEISTPAIPRAMASERGVSLGGPPRSRRRGSTSISSGSRANSSVPSAGRSPDPSNRGSAAEETPSSSPRVGFGSQSTASVCAPPRARSRATSAEIVVFPTPPLPAIVTFSGLVSRCVETGRSQQGERRTPGSGSGIPQRFHVRRRSPWLPREAAPSPAG